MYICLVIAAASSRAGTEVVQIDKKGLGKGTRGRSQGNWLHLARRATQIAWLSALCSPRSAVSPWTTAENKMNLSFVTSDSRQLLPRPRFSHAAAIKWGDFCPTKTGTPCGRQNANRSSQTTSVQNKKAASNKTHRIQSSIRNPVPSCIFGTRP